ncbi:MAG: DUF721 domain-containing protein [Rickettsiaceae bacterium]|nr:DUF721 domain-containing protein [Rickettsiaceae bacterium]
MGQIRLDESLKIILKNFFQKKGDIFSEIASSWTNIVGPEYSKIAVPSNIKYYKTSQGKKTELVLYARNNVNLIELKFAENIILERIRDYFGYIAVNSLKIKRG